MSELDQVSTETDEWPTKAANTIVGYVDTVRGATTGKALLVSRLAVYFLAAGLVGFVAAIVALIALVRLLVILTSNLPFIDTGEVWLAYYIVGGLFLLAGWWLWRKRGR